LPYGLIGTFLALAVVAYAAYASDGQVRLFFGLVLLLFFLLPFLIRFPIAPVIILMVRMLAGIAALIYLRFKAHGG
jgi:hypothetical protein